MLIQSLEAYVEKDLDKAQKVIADDDVIDDLFEEVKQELIEREEIMLTKGNRQ